MTNEFSVKWVIAREVIHLAYDYNNGGPTQWDYISNLDSEDLDSLLDFYELQKYTKKVNTENALNWHEVKQLVKSEIKYRENITS